MIARDMTLNELEEYFNTHAVYGVIFNALDNVLQVSFTDNAIVLGKAPTNQITINKADITKISLECIGVGNHIVTLYPVGKLIVL